MATSADIPGNKNFTFGGLIKALLPIAALLVIIAGGLYLVKRKMHLKIREGALIGPVAVGSVLPDFPLHAYQSPGKSTAGAASGAEKVSDLGGKVMLINFWATWCEACMAEMPSLVKLDLAYKDHGLRMVPINLDETPETALPKAIEELKIGFPIYRDDDQKLSDLFDVHAIPLTVIIDQDRKVLFIENGERDWNSQDIRTKMETWLAG